MSIRSLSIEEIQQRIDSIGWYHEFDFGDGLHAEVKTPDAQSHRVLWAFIADELNKLDFKNKTVLDIGCWDGYWSFYAERRGASRVLATDDSSQNWAGDNGFFLAKELLGSSIESDTKLSIYDLSRLNKKFDIILCLGVYYHLIDPFYAFAQVRHCCHENSIIVFEGDVLFGLRQNSALYGRSVAQRPRFSPEPETLRFLLQATYFSIQSESFLPLLPPKESVPPPQPSTLWSTFKSLISSKFKSTRKSAVVSDGSLLEVQRVLMVCKPFVGNNECYLYIPPFGLDAYDSRYGLPPGKWLSKSISPL
jgi:tRNA (mo5U34)-methyltransferase